MTSSDERKVVTVLFADLAGSRSRHDAEVGRRLIERALGIFEEIGATGWIAEARAAMGQS